ncbi:MAG: site-specific DNA-methyltransferase [bacterium]|nr:site-specific DNA-methyltransferase [Candidatus Limimorpha caballi]
MNATKQSLIAEIERRVSDRILEQTNADLLIKLINNADSLDEAINIAALGTTYRRTGLHFDKRLEKMSDTIKYFRKNEALSFHTDDSKPTHKLIIGDNYEALQNLLIQYRGKVDVIYIDPPYGKDSMGEFAQTNYNNAITRDNLLSMLYPRLVLAKQLLSEDGVIFCSMDDKNQAYVKCLFDEVMGEGNFVGNICREAIKGGSKARNVKSVHDYVIVFAKKLSNGNEQKDILVGEEFEENYCYEYEDTKGKYAKGRELNKWGASSRREDSPSMWFPIKGPNYEDVYPIRNDGSEGRWRWGKEKMLKAVEGNDVIFEKRDDGSFVVYEKIRKNKIKNKQLVSILKDMFLNAQGSEELKDIFSTLMSPFDYAKPTKLISELVQYFPTDDSIVLDFFAGSGTTGHAVLELNQQDGGNRTFILCQLNEKTDTTPNGIAYDVTSKRLKRIMTGECYDGTKDFEWIKKNKPYGGNLDVYEIESVSNFEWTEGKTPFDVIDETLYGNEKFATIREKIDWVCSNFDKTQQCLESGEEWLKRIMEE